MKHIASTGLNRMLDDPIKVLHISVRSDVGGGPEHVFQLLSHLPPGIECSVASPFDPPYSDKFSAHVGENRHIELPHRTFAISYLFDLARFIRVNKVSVVHSHGKGAGLYGRLLAIFTPALSVHTFHGLHDKGYHGIKRWLYYQYEKFFGSITSRAICVSQSEKEQIMLANLVPLEKVFVVENGVEFPEARPGEPSPDRTIITAVNRFDFQKNAELILDIAKILEIRLGRDSFCIQVFGTGESRSECLMRAEALGLRDVVLFPGSTSLMRNELRKSHIFLSTSRWEGMPLAVLEAMSEGLPVVLSDVSGNNDIVEHGKTGYLYPIDEPELACDAIAELTDNRLRMSVGLNAREAVKRNYSVDKMAQRTASIYLDALGR